MIFTYCSSKVALTSEGFAPTSHQAKPLVCHMGQTTIIGWYSCTQHQLSVPVLSFRMGTLFVLEKILN